MGWLGWLRRGQRQSPAEEIRRAVNEMDVRSALAIMGSSLEVCDAQDSMGGLCPKCWVMYPTMRGGERCPQCEPFPPYLPPEHGAVLIDARLRERTPWNLPPA